NSEAKPGPKLSAAGLRIGVVVSRFNARITDRLRKGALEALKTAGATDAQMDIVDVPGAFEIPLTAKRLAEAKKVDAVIAIGCVLRGETDHYNYVCSEVARGVQLAQLDTGVPIIFCVLTCESDDQALERSGGKLGNKGYDAGLAAIEMATFMRRNPRKVIAASAAPKKDRAKSKARGRK
ncbi:MAG TPA: 6,7-dimethyl-8-ribityllumazine synthase, partial [Candidatus Acidoferrales bacterium]|nr:6,7-dimethyl-8-ribityllumazine synthase [Candidatus Acidoferrales bacterium]